MSAIRPSPPVDSEAPRFGLRTPNLVFLAAGLAAIVGGYVLLDAGSTVAAPLLLVLGYVILIPAGLLYGLRRPRPNEAGTAE